MAYDMDNSASDSAKSIEEIKKIEAGIEKEIGVVQKQAADIVKKAREEKEAKIIAFAASFMNSLFAALGMIYDKLKEKK